MKTGCYLVACRREGGFPHELNLSGFPVWVGVGGGGGLPLKVRGMFIVSLQGANHGFWSHLGCSGQNANIFSCYMCKVFFRVTHKTKQNKKTENNVLLFWWSKSIGMTIFNVLSLSHGHIGLLSKFLMSIPMPFM